MNNAIGQNKKKKLTYPLVDGNGENITSTEEVANKFCKYFTNIGPNLADKIAPASKSFRDFINTVPPDLLSSFNYVTVEELKSIAKGFKDGKAPGADNIPISIVKKTLDLISDPLLSIINLSLSSGVFPDRLKISKIIPIFKSDNASLAQNYRPISILPAFSKIFERAVYNRIFQFLVDNDILFKHQFGFRPGHSTSHALVNFVNKVANAVDCQKYVAGIFLDLSKAFDTLNHEILLSKLEAYGINGSAHQWITNYFCNRIQFVQIGNSKSDALRQICGVPQGSILGPLFFILYINDLPACCNELEFILFADDTSIFFEHNDLDVLTSHLNVQLNNVSTWLKANKLSINVKKTKLMIFRPRQKTVPITRQIVLDNNALEQVDNTKFLGVYIGQHLEWKTHVNFIAAKISKSVGLLYKAKYYLPSKSLLTLYYALIYPYLTYCNLIWASNYVTNLQRIYLLQKRAVRAISKADYKASSKPLFANLKILDVFSIYSLQVSSFMYLYHNDALPISFTQIFQTGNQINRYSTRYSDFYRPHICRTNIKEFSILFQGPRIWNSLPNDIKNAPSFSIFKRMIKPFLRVRQNAT